MKKGIAATALLLSMLVTAGRAQVSPDLGAGQRVSPDISPAVAGSTTVLTSSPNPAVLGKPVTLTATVTPPAATGGLVTFFDGASIAGTTILVNGHAGLSTSFLAAGMHLLKVTYAGDGNYGPSGSTTSVQNVVPLPATGYPVFASYAAGNEPQSSVIGDFNGDGKADIAVANYVSNTVSVFLGNGDGTFQPAVNSFAGSGPYALAVGDFNADGRSDLAVANFNGGSAANILLSNGDGSFQAPIVYGAGGGPRAIAVGDVNGDGRPDFVVANSFTGNVTVFIGNGDGTFKNGLNYPVSTASTPSGIVIADVNGDGSPDLVVSDDGTGNVWVLPNNGSGAFPTATPHPAGNGPRGVVVGDFNGDGIPDLAVANFLDSTVAVLLGKGNLLYQAPQVYRINSGPNAIAMGDFNGDGKVDLIVADGTNVSVLLGNGDGTFPGVATDYSAGGLANSIAVGEFNGDGVTDLASANNNTLSVLPGRPAVLTTTSLTSSANPSSYGQTITLTATVSSPGVTGSVTFYDGGSVLGVQPPANGQATFTTSVLSYGSHSLKVIYSGDGNYAPSSGALTQAVTGALPAVTLTSSANPSQQGQSVTLIATVTPAMAFGTVTFYDGTTLIGSRAIAGGQAVLVTSSLASGVRNLKAYFAFSAVGAPPSAAGSLVQTVNAAQSTGLLLTSTNGTGSRPYAVVAADFTGTGKIGLAVANYGGGTVSVLPGNGNGTFQTGVIYNVGTNSLAIASGDFNQDGKIDLAVVNNGNNNVNILLGNGDATFVVQSALVTGNSPVAIAVGDFNGDGKADIAVANQGDGSIWIFTGKGDGTFQNGGHFASGGLNPSSLAVGDFNGDGKADLVITNITQGCVNCTPLPYVDVLLGNGDGTFQSALPTTFNVSKPMSVVVGDFNGDGKADIAVADQTSNGVVVFLGNGNGTFKPGAGYGSAAGSPTAVATGDINGDGNPDLIVANQSGNNVSVYMGNGDGTFQSAVNYPTGNQPTSIAVADFDHDGRTDIAVANQGSGNLSVFLGAATQLKFATQPVNVVGGAALPSIVVQVVNSSGVVDTTSSVAVTMSSVPTGILATVNAVQGIATFNGLSVNAGGTYSLLASAPGYVSATSNSFVVSATPSVVIDTPAAGAIITSGSTVVTGWAVESTTAIGTPISQVQVLLDGVVVGTATYGLNRPDVCAAYPNRPSCPNVGYTFTLNTNGLSTGMHTITVSATDSANPASTGANSTVIEVTQLMMTGTRAGIYRAGQGFLEDTNGNGVGPAPTDPADHTDAFVPPGGLVAGDLPVIGDWTGDGHAKAGFYRPSTGTWWLDANNDGTFDAGDFTYSFGGLAGDLPFVGDWTGLGRACVGIYRSQGSVWLLDLNCNGQFDGTPNDAFFPFGGLAGDVPVVGAWTGNGTRVGVVRKYAPGGVPQGNPFYWVLDGGAANAGNTPENHPPAAGSYAFGGLAGDVFITGDWNNTGITRAGVYRGGLWVLDVNGTHNPDLTFGYGGLGTDVPVPGKW